MVSGGGGAEFAIGYEILELVEPELIVLSTSAYETAPRDSGPIAALEARRPVA